MTQKKSHIHGLVYLILIGMILLTGCSLDRQSHSKPSVGEMTQDLINFQATLMQTHPLLRVQGQNEKNGTRSNQGDYSSDLKEEIIEDFANLRQSITRDTETEDIVWALKKIVSKLGDEHTHVNTTTADRSLPVRFKYTSSGLVTVDDHELIPKGSLVKKIGDKPVSTIIDMLGPVSPKGLDNVLYGGIVSNHLYTENYLDHLGLVTNGDSVQLDISIESGQNSSVTLTLGNYRFEKEPDYAYTFDQASSTGKFVIRNYMSASDFDKVWAAFIDEYRVLKPQNMVIDLRQSIGGMDEYYITDTILSSLGIDKYQTPYPAFYKQAYHQDATVPVTKHFDPIVVENLYVAVSNYTISAPTIFAATVKENKLATIIGQPVANNLSFYASGSYYFEHLPIQAGISGFKLEYTGSEIKTNQPLQPDISLPLFAGHIKDNIDPVIEWIASGQVARD